jgi:hypothetical protein
MTGDWVVANDFHHAAHDYAHKEATKVARQVKKAIKRTPGLDVEALVETAYKSAYEPAYRDRLLLGLVSLFRREMTFEGKRLNQDHAENLAADASSEHLRQVFGAGRGVLP